VGDLRGRDEANGTKARGNYIHHTTSYAMVGNNVRDIDIASNVIRNVAAGYAIWCQNLANSTGLGNIRVCDNDIDMSDLPATSTLAAIVVSGGTPKFYEVDLSGNRVKMTASPTTSSQVCIEVRGFSGIVSRNRSFWPARIAACGSGS
jgi:hypothetical protein